MGRRLINLARGGRSLARLCFVDRRTEALAIHSRYPRCSSPALQGSHALSWELLGSELFQVLRNPQSTSLSRGSSCEEACASSQLSRPLALPFPLHRPHEHPRECTVAECAGLHLPGSLQGPVSVRLGHPESTTLRRVLSKPGDPWGALTASRALSSSSSSSSSSTGSNSGSSSGGAAQEPKADSPWAKSLNLVLAPGRAASTAAASLSAQLATWRRAVGQLRAIRALSKTWKAFQELPPVSKSVEEARKAIARRQDALGMQAQAFWRTNSRLLIGVAGVSSVLVLDNVLLWFSALFVAHPVPFSTHLNCLGLAAAPVVGLGLFLQHRTAIDVDTVCSMALSRLNSHPGTLEVLGAPVAQGVPLHSSSGSVTAALLVGGGVKITFGLKQSPVLLGLDLPPRTCLCVFGVKGADASGVANAVVTKHNGQYRMEALAVDVYVGTREQQQDTPSAGVPEVEQLQQQQQQQQRVYVVGSPAECAPFAWQLSSLGVTIQGAVAGQGKQLS